MELWDVYDKFRHKTDKTHERGNSMQAGDYHFVSHIWIVNDNGEYLIQKRQPWKKGWPNMWDSSAKHSRGISKQGNSTRNYEATRGDVPTSGKLATCDYIG